MKTSNWYGIFNCHSLSTRGYPGHIFFKFWHPNQLGTHSASVHPNPISAAGIETGTLFHRCGDQSGLIQLLQVCRGRNMTALLEFLERMTLSHGPKKWLKNAEAIQSYISLYVPWSKHFYRVVTMFGNPYIGHYDSRFWWWYDHPPMGPSDATLDYKIVIHPTVSPCISH